jgi:hypothetical protein
MRRKLKYQDLEGVEVRTHRFTFKLSDDQLEVAGSKSEVLELEELDGKLDPAVVVKLEGFISEETALRGLRLIVANIEKYGIPMRATVMPRRRLDQYMAADRYRTYFVRTDANGQEVTEPELEETHVCGAQPLAES